MPVDQDDIAVALGRTTPEQGSVESEQWLMWIADARMLIEARLGDLSALDQEKLDYVVREAVVAHVRNPDDATNVTVSVDDASTSRNYRSGSGRVAIRDEWWKLLDPGADSGKAFSVDTAPGCGTAHLPWCTLRMGGSVCSCGTVLAGYPIYELG